MEPDPQLGSGSADQAVLRRTGHRLPQKKSARPAVIMPLPRIIDTEMRSPFRALPNMRAKTGVTRVTSATVLADKCFST